MVTCLLLLGSNLGDRRAHLSRAVRLIHGLPGCRVLRKSRIYDTSPVPASAGGRFLNLSLKIETSLSPMGLLIELKRIEALAGRRPGRSDSPRTLDIDIISFGGRKIRTPWLRVPHPAVQDRLFAMAPLADIAPSWRPAGRETAARLRARLKGGRETVRILP